MDIIDFGSNKVKLTIQIKLMPQVKGENMSRSLTIYGMDIDEAYNRIHNLFQQLANSNGEVVIKHFRRCSTYENTEGH